MDDLVSPIKEEEDESMHSKNSLPSASLAIPMRNKGLNSMSKTTD